MLKKVPIQNIGDPYVLKYQGQYYLYATSDFDGFYVWSSRNLNTWSAPMVCYRKTSACFGEQRFWAPEVYEWDEKFYMYYTADWKITNEENLRIGVAVSDKPTGPFADVYDTPMFDAGFPVLDAHVLKDGEQDYLLFSRAGECNIVNGAKEADIYLLKLNPDHVSVSGEAILLITPEEQYEKQNHDMNQYWVEGPFVVKNSGRYHLMYSANYYGSSAYCICCAVSDSPEGPYAKYIDNPIIESSKAISGPGHNSVVEALDGKGSVCVFHVHSDAQYPGSDRQVCLAPLEFKNGLIRKILL